MFISLLREVRGVLQRKVRFKVIFIEFFNVHRLEKLLIKHRRHREKIKNKKQYSSKLESIRACARVYVREIKKKKKLERWIQSAIFFSRNENELRLILVDQFSPETINVTSPPEIASDEHGSEFSRRGCCEVFAMWLVANNSNNSISSWQTLSSIIEKLKEKKKTRNARIENYGNFLYSLNNIKTTKMAKTVSL